MNYDALIEALQLKQYTKLITDSTITSVKMNKKDKTINVFLCVSETWPFAAYKGLKQAFEDFTGPAGAISQAATCGQLCGS